eukprot:4790006-Heterocapsa_arctica.AAC.1
MIFSPSITSTNIASSSRANTPSSDNARFLITSLGIIFKKRLMALGACCATIAHLIWSGTTTLAASSYRRRPSSHARRSTSKLADEVQ